MTRFFYASLQTDILLEERNASKAISIALAELLSSIKETWERLLLNIDKTKELEKDRQTVKKLLQWLVVATRPLTFLKIRAGTNRFQDLHTVIRGPFVGLNDERAAVRYHRQQLV
jgi:hypothetical protein